MRDGAPCTQGLSVLETMKNRAPPVGNIGRLEPSSVSSHSRLPSNQGIIMMSDQGEGSMGRSPVFLVIECEVTPPNGFARHLFLLTRMSTLAIWHTSHSPG
ncbi:hypothetical protein VNO77_19698 [Canavalia gladiata]|uniref:Uncharacterized protein n=1 Tax=Canavalia gladiata TaxID=3824 RepID=A0AAN9LN09_CANGL